MTFNGGNKIQFFQFPWSLISAKSLFTKCKVHASVSINNNFVSFTLELYAEAYCKNAKRTFLTQNVYLKNLFETITRNFFIHFIKINHLLRLCRTSFSTLLNMRL